MSKEDFVPAYNRSDEFYEKHEGLVVCGCMGEARGEPYCPCVMASLGLPKSIENVEDTKEMQVRWEEFMASGPFNAE